MKLTGLFLVVILSSVWAQSARDKAVALMNQMTQTEKLAMVHGYSGPYVGNVPANTRLNIPAINLEDGPQGVADNVNYVTCWPSSLAIAATWDVDLMYQWAQAMGLEQYQKGTNVMLGPDINIARVPLGGRIFEMFGEDPILTATLVRQSVAGIQSQQVIATAKHFIDNDQEYERGTISIEVDERSQHEIYYPQFAAAVDAGVGAIMCSYNRINGTYSCEQPQTLSDLKNGMGFQGWVMSDWGATHSTVASALAGLDQEMNDNEYFGGALATAISNGQVPQSRLDDMVTRILTPFYATGAINNMSPTGNLGVNVTSDAHNELALILATAAIVLLQNTRNILPLVPAGHSYAVIGDAASINPIIAGGGSGHVNAPYTITPLEGIQNRVGTGGKVSYSGTNPISTAVEVARSADYAIVFVGAESSEGSDRANLSLAYPQDDLITQIAAANPNTIVVVNAPGPVLMPWASAVMGILFGFFPGQESGNAIARVLFGDSNPAAKLPVSFPMNENDWFSGDANQYPGVDGVMQYSEKLEVGYRWYQAQNIVPLWPFGHGLTYAFFSYHSLAITGSIPGTINVTFTLQNTGAVNGAEVPQLYLGFPDTAGEPPMVLRKFSKIALDVNVETSVVFQLGDADLEIWSIVDGGWLSAHGTFNVYIGASSSDIRLKGQFTA